MQPFLGWMPKIIHPLLQLPRFLSPILQGSGFFLPGHRMRQTRQGWQRGWARRATRQARPEKCFFRRTP